MRELKFPQGSWYSENQGDQESNPCLLPPLLNFCLNILALCVLVFTSDAQGTAYRQTVLGVLSDCLALLQVRCSALE